MRLLRQRAPRKRCNEHFRVLHPPSRGDNIMSIALVAGGIFGYLFLPVAALPRAWNSPSSTCRRRCPSVRARHHGERRRNTLIKQFATIAGIDTISATSSQGSTSISVQFNLNRDIDSAAADIQSAIARVQRQLPSEMTEPPSYRKVNPADAPIMILALSGAITPLPEMDAFGQQVISPALSTIEGVAQVQGVTRQSEIRCPHPARPRMCSRPAASGSTRCRRHSVPRTR